MRDDAQELEFDDWLTGCKAILFKVVNAYANNHANRQDLFQEIVLRLWRSREAFRGDSLQTT